MQPALSLDHVRSFVIVAEEKHFGRAARRLRMTQPPLSRHVQRLERDVGVRLLDRTPHGVELTVAGRAFLPDARRLLALAEAAVRTTRRAATGGAGELSIGFTPLSGLTVLGAVLERIERVRPGVKLSLHELSSTAQLDLLRSGVLDLGLVRPPVDARILDSQLIGCEPLALAVPCGHHLWGDTPLDVGCLAGTALLAFAPDEARHLAQIVARALGPVHRTVSDSVSTVHTMLALVAAGRGLGVVPASAARLRLRGVALRPLLTTPVRPVELHLAWRRGTANPALVESLSALSGLELDLAFSSSPCPGRARAERAPSQSPDALPQAHLAGEPDE
jgi:DNA-binding transcriptional LysR family regulator